MRRPKTNVAMRVAVYQAVGWAVYGSMSVAATGAVYRAVGRAVEAAVYRAVRQAVFGALHGVVKEEPVHPALQDFLRSMGVES